MKEFENIKTGRPFKESTEYVEQLLERCTNEAMRKPRTSRLIVRPWNYGLAGAVAAAAVAVGIFVFKPKTIIESSLDNSPLESFLASITDDQAQQIQEGFVIDIPEYYR